MFVELMVKNMYEFNVLVVKLLLDILSNSGDAVWYE
jgi:hypothetical protein